MVKRALDSVLYVRCSKWLLDALDRYCEWHEKQFGVRLSRSNAARAILEQNLKEKGALRGKEK